jgi:CHAD domain-containing protein
MNADHIERELQFEAPDLAAVAAWIEAQPPHAAIAIEAADHRSQHDTYFDTTDWAVYRAGYALRLRRLPEGGEATLKALTDSAEGAQQRREINEKTSAPEAGWSTEAGPVTDRVRLITGGRAVEALFDVETDRRNYRLSRDGAALATLSLDESAVLREGQVLCRLQRVEVEEEREGGIEGVQILVDALARARGLERAATSKFAAGLQCAGLDPKAALDFGPTTLREDATAGAYALAVLRRYTRDFLRHEPGTRLGEDPEELHDMRVAIRRLRAAMATFEPVLPPRFQTFRHDLQAAGLSLGLVRDLDVQIDWLTGVKQTSDWDGATALGPLFEVLAERRAAARQELLATLDSEGYLALVQSLTEALRAGEEVPGDAEEPVRPFALKVLKKRYRGFKKEGEGLTETSEAPLYHAARIRGKRLRYAVEALQPLFGRPGARLAAAMTGVQDLLGEHQDCSVAIAWLRETATERGPSFPPATLLRMGELIEQRRARMGALRAGWPDALAEVKKRRRRLRKSMRQGHKPVEDPEEPPSPPPPRRSFWTLPPFLRRHPGPGPT